MRTFKRLALSLITAGTGVLVACAYGMFYSWRGWVKDASTQTGIPGLRVSCVAGGVTVASDTTDAQGAFDLDHDGTCDQLRIEDVDGASNGTYDGTTIDAPLSGEPTYQLPPS